MSDNDIMTFYFFLDVPVCMYIYIYICVYVCMYVCMYVYIYIYIYIYTHTHTGYNINIKLEYIFLLCQKSLGYYVKIMFHEYI